MQSMSDIMQECKNFSLALDALHTRHSWIVRGAQDITRNNDTQKFAIDCAFLPAAIDWLQA